MQHEFPHKYILVGASGTGKSTMAEHLESALGLTRCITCTTRPPRPGEMEKGEYHFVESFDMLSMFEQAEFGGHRYGITNDELTKGDFVILDPQGVDYYLKNYPGTLTVIKLERSGIDVDPERRARDAGAGFDAVQADITVHGETVEDMQKNLTAALLSYEAARLRENNWSPLADKFLQKETHGRIALHFQDAVFDLNVTSEEHHREYLEHSFDDDGLCCFAAADYELLFSAFSRMVEKKQSCTLDFLLENEENCTLYWSRLVSEDGRISGELFPEYLGMEPHVFTAKTAAQALSLAYGGFVAAESDCLRCERRFSHLPDQDKVVDFYRDVFSAGKYKFWEGGDPERQASSLDDKIRAAIAARGYQLQKMFQQPVNDRAAVANER